MLIKHLELSGKNTVRFLSIMLCFFSLQGVFAQENNYEVGVGIYDVTGQIAQTNFFGYAELLHRNTGIRDRQYARAFIVQEPDRAPVVFVSIDKGGMFQSVNEEVMRKLRSKFGSLYNDNNIIISATHTHVAAGGFSYYGLYNTATGGFWKANFDNLVEGIVGAIERAHKNIAPGRVYFNKGELTGASINRSKKAFYENKEVKNSIKEGLDVPSSIDKEMTVLKFIQGEKEVGMISWFAVHPTSLSNNYRHNSSDNKGYAALKFERMMRSTYNENGSFVAAFANTNAGDLSPNLNLPKEDEPYQDATGPGEDEEESSEIIGQMQFDKALELYNSANTQLFGSVKAISRYNDFSNITVAPRFTGEKDAKHTCNAALGVSFSAGAEDGRSGISREGITKDPKDGNAAGRCHAEKPIMIFFHIGENETDPRGPKILPTSIMKIGQLGILAAPAEFTVMSGRRSRETVMNVEGTGIQETVLAGYSDAYAGYVTTREEYSSQQYEGASTHFGPWTLAAYQQEFYRLATKLADPSVEPWPKPEPKVPYKTAPKNVTAPIIKDHKPSSKEYGSIKKDAEENYIKGNKVDVAFWGGHPNNDLKTNSSYLTVEHWDGEKWTPLYFDRDPVTKLTWKRVGTTYSHIEIEWKIPSDAPTGYYRIKHSGKWKHGGNGRRYDYSGISNRFFVE